METATNKLVYRLYEEKDLPSILTLWEQHSGWGAITETQFAKWYLHTPFGQCLIVVAANEQDEIVGQMVFTSSVVLINNREVKAYRGAAPILNPDYRQPGINSGEHPAVGMIKCAREQGIKRGYKIFYSFPAQGWLALLKAFPKFGLPKCQMVFFNCVSIPLDGIVKEVSKDYKSGIVQHFSEEYNQLWNEATDSFPIRCSVVRKADWLTWKISGHLVVEVRQKDSNRLLGYTAINKKSGLIVDMLARTEADLKKLLTQTIYSLHHSNPDRYPLPLTKLTGMLTPEMERASQNMSVGRERFTFAFGCFLLDDSISFDDVHPSKWYMMPND